ncbi:MAG: DUF3987 domain-containing protein, partial [Kovacikia sp.]
MSPTFATTQPFDIRSWINADPSGRAACPACLQDGKIRQKNLSIDLSTGAYKCWRGCTPDQIRAALNAPQRNQNFSSVTRSIPQRTAPAPKPQPRTVSAEQVRLSHQRLTHQSGEPQQQALDWLIARGFTHEMIGHYKLGLEPKWITSDNNNPNARACYWAIALHIPANEPGQFYRKLRVAPWLTGENRPDTLSNWSQYGVPATVFYTHRPEHAEATWFCEGEWDALRLGWLAKQRDAQVAVCCSTAGCGTVPPQEQLDQLPGTVILFFDRNDEPTQNGLIPGEEGARKLALALDGRGRIAQVPMPEDCQVSGWDVSNALEAGFCWEDFEAAARIATSLSAAELENRKAANRSIRDQVLTVLHRYEAQSERDVALMDLSRTTPYSYRELEKLAQSLAIEVDVQTDQVEANRKLKDLLQTRPTQLNLNRYLEPWFARVMIETANAMPTAPEFLFTTLLSAAASRVGTAAQVIIKPSAQYTQPMVFWSAIVANSGSMKTPAQRVILDPLVALEREAYEAYQFEMADY